MGCLSCQRAAPQGKGFCIDCGTPLPTSCRSCGATIPSTAKFCCDCGFKIAEGAAPATQPFAPRGAGLGLSAERRHVTVMFCDLVGSTALSARIDPEDMGAVIGTYHRCVSDIVSRFDGFVAKHMGDGVLIYFGYPWAHEDDAERAVRAGLELVAAVFSLKPRADTDLQCRIGIATGLVVVGDLVGAGEFRERSIVGETPNLAARLQALAKPNDVIITQTTRRLVGDLFEYNCLGAVEVKGMAEPVEICEVIRPSALESRFEALRANTLSPLVGRDEEIELLLRSWSQSAHGNGQVVLLSGEPGIGKSRLATTLEEKLENEPHTRMRYFSSSYHREHALYPIISQLRRAASLEPDDTPETSLKKLEALLSSNSPSGEEVVLLAELLSIPVPEERQLNDVTPLRRKEKTFDALLRYLELLAHDRPMLIVYEDVHWLDPTSRDLLNLTIARVRHLPVLLLVTFRPEFQPSWTSEPHVTMLELGPLDRRQGVELVERLGKKELGQDIIAEIVDRTDGVPLFVEELTKAVIEAGAHEITSASRQALLTAPASLQALLMARLDRLGLPARGLAQIGAAIGREFSYDLLAAVACRSHTELQSALIRLTEAGLIFCQGSPPDALFLFKHALVQDVAYGMLLRSERLTLHTRIVEVLEVQFPRLVESEPALLAHHSAAAGLIEKAAEYFGAAGRQAIARSAMSEAVAMLRKALAIITQLPNDASRWRRELALQSALGVALIAVKGYAASETGAVYNRARVLCDQLGDVKQLIRVASGQFSFHLVRAEMRAARRTAEDLLQNADTSGATDAKFTAHHLMGTSLFCRGRLTAACAHLELAALKYTPYTRVIDTASGTRGANLRVPGVAVPSLLAVTLCLLGRYREARMQCDLALAGARRSGRPLQLAYAVGGKAWLHALLREDAGGLIDELSVIAREQSFPYWAAVASIYEAGAAAQKGKPAEAAAMFAESVKAHRAIGSRSMIPWWAGLVASVLNRDEAEVLLSEQLRQIEETGERWCAADIHRVRGEVAWRRGDLRSAQAYLRKAIALAQAQKARHWELRAATSLARLWHDQGRLSEGGVILSAVYGCFTEEGDTPDLKDAKALLHKLGDQRNDAIRDRYAQLRQVEATGMSA
jgi:class 3 adenylate cyclase/tetratricopeptide (TPR) repeat protein